MVNPSSLKSYLKKNRFIPPPFEKLERILIMDVKLFRGDIWGVPIGGSLVSITSAEIAGTLSAASGLAKALFFISASGLALATGLAGLYLFLRSRRESVPLNVMTEITSHSRSFKGICISDVLTCKSDGQSLSIPIPYIKRVEKELFEKVYSVQLYDNSNYKLEGFIGPNSRLSLRFLTSLGEQRVELNPQENVRMEGCVISEIEKLKMDLIKFLDARNGDIVQLIGKGTFETFFYPGN